MKTAVSPLERFLGQVERPLVIAGTLKEREREAVKQFLLALHAPAYLEAVSGLREDPSLVHIRVKHCDDFWAQSDGILRIGGVPTARLWRDLEAMEGKAQLCSVSSLPFPGQSWGELYHTCLETCLPNVSVRKRYAVPESWQGLSEKREEQLHVKYRMSPQCEQSLIHHLSARIPQGALVYLGNSSPIRHWDRSAVWDDRGFKIEASRGLNGIDGQLSTFFGLCQSGRENWAVLGDLTFLYDLAAPWILSQLPHLTIKIVVINNGGGKIFASLYPQQEFQNPHRLHFKGIAEMWGIPYYRWESIPGAIPEGSGLIELVPDAEK